MFETFVIVKKTQLSASRVNENMNKVGNQENMNIPLNYGTYIFSFFLTSINVVINKHIWHISISS